MATKKKSISVRVNVTSPFGRPGNMIEVDPEHPGVKHQLAKGYLTQIEVPQEQDNGDAEHSD